MAGDVACTAAWGGQEREWRIAAVWCGVRSLVWSEEENTRGIHRAKGLSFKFTAV